MHVYTWHAMRFSFALAILDGCFQNNNNCNNEAQ